MVFFTLASLLAHRPALPQQFNDPFFDDLDEHVKTRIAEYLDPASLSSFSCTSKSAQLISLKELWLRHCSDKWGFTPAYDKLKHDVPLNSIYPHCHAVQNRVHHCSSLKTTITDEHTVRIHYSGPVGVGNRAASSTAPFPEIPSSKQQQSWLGTFLNCFTSKSKESQPDGCVFVSRPFKTGTGGVDVNVYPVAYFEITIHPSGNAASRMTANAASGSVPECVALGLSRQQFNLTRMPGWDELSYGYHSDDGCLFHGKGTQLRAFGPCYGRGDTVGCGIDYRTHEVFYTLNGKLVGVAFTNVTGSLYPTVGVDANVDVEINFGQKPYAFALDHFATKAQ